MNTKWRVAVVFGGNSVEHEVSVISAMQTIASLDKEKYDVLPVYLTKNNEMYVGDGIDSIDSYKDVETLLKSSTRVVMVNDSGVVKFVSYPFRRLGKNEQFIVDVVFPVVHGTNVEDGTLQGFFKSLGVPCVGCSVLSSAIGMDKYVMKAVLKDAGVPVLDALLFTIADYKEVDVILFEVEKKFGFPVIVKPANLGSSVGIGLAKNREELEQAIDNAFRYSSRVMIEHAILNLREINCSVLGDESSATASECEEPLHSDEILSYEDKYVNGAKGSGAKGMASVSRKVPADLDSKTKAVIQSMAVKAFHSLGCCGVSRIDFMIDQDSNELFLNEINTIPGSLAYYLWEASGISHREMLDKLIQITLRKQREEKNLVFSFDTNILSESSIRGTKGAKV